MFNTVQIEKTLEKLEPTLRDLASSYYHAGRHAERDKLVKSGYLMINPEKIEELKKDLHDPCSVCEFHVQDYKMGCSVDPKHCERKKKQFLAIEIDQYFKKTE